MARTSAPHPLAARVKGPVSVPGDGGYDEERAGFQAVGRHRPAVVVGATGAEDVRAAVRYAAERGLPVAVQATGHGLPLAAEGGVLVSTRRMNAVHLDGDAATARFGAGARWEHVVNEAAPYGLAPLSGSAPSVGAVSYTLGGGIGLMSRRYGFAADHVRAIEVVTADGALRRVTADGDPDLFWALRGGRANFGVVTALETALFPVARLYGGGLYFDAGLVPEVLRVYAEWADDLPDAMTTSVALIPFPAAPFVPSPLRGRHVAHVRITHTGDSTEGERLIAPLRAIGPRLLDTVRDLPYTASGTIHDEPSQPMGYHATHSLLHTFDATTAKTVLDLAGPDAPDPRVVELRHLGGAMTAPPAVDSAVSHRDAGFLLGLLSRLGSSEDVETARPAHTRFEEALAAWATGGQVLNFLYGENARSERVRAAYAPETYRRLAGLKAEHDPSNLFRHNHNIPPTTA